MGARLLCLSSEAKVYSGNMYGISQVSALESLEVSASQRFKCISIIGYFNGAAQLSTLGAVSSLRRVRFRRLHCRDGVYKALFITYHTLIVEIISILHSHGSISPA